MQNDSVIDRFCPYYEQGMFIDSNPQGQTRIAMCCYQQRSEPVDRVTFDHAYLQRIRAESKTNIPGVCHADCKSANLYFNERVQSQSADWWDQSGQKIKKLHLKQGLICNLQCISCSSELSSAWGTHYHHFDPASIPIKLNPTAAQSWKLLDLSSLEEIHFDGGEPLLNKENQQILEDLDQQNLLPQITLSYNTNGTILPSDRLIQLWSKVKWVRLYISLDGVGTTFEYTRYPANWAQTEQNIFTIQRIQGPCILIEVDAIIGIHNIFNMPDFCKWYESSSIAGNQGDPSKIFIRPIRPSSVGGEVLGLRHLPIELKAQALDVLQNLKHITGVSDCVKEISLQPNTSWIEYLEKLDRIRATDWRSSLPPQLKAVGD